MKRSHNCGDLRESDTGKKALLQGWVNTRRDHGGVIFIDLRDRYGLTQVCFDPKTSETAHKLAEDLGREYVIEVAGTVAKRPGGMENPKLATGKIELDASELKILNEAKTPPFELDDRTDVNEDLRLKYRYIDLRRERMQKNLILRHVVTKAARDYLSDNDFLEIETPILGKSTPEGARDYLVPSRVHPGKFYALPQSPQLFKQLLMVSGFDRYVQFAKCFRDEDLRADRQPEFTQIDLEMSFVEVEDILELMEGMITRIWKDAKGVDLKTPFPRMKYAEAMARFGSDKPDLRFGMELIDVEDAIKGCDFGVFNKAIELGGCIRCINAKGCASFSRKDIDGLTKFVAIYGAKGLAWIKVSEEGNLESSIVKFLNEDNQKKLVEVTGAEKGDLLLFVADKHKTVHDSLGALRCELARRLNLLDSEEYKFVWVIDFPLFDWDEDAERHVAVHHPFTAPYEEDLKFLESDPGKVCSKAYDLALNGVELGGGSIRIHQRDIQEKMFKALGISVEEAQEKFGFLMNAFTYGAPPHGGIAFGLDRVVAILAGEESIREVMAFPKNKAAQSLMEEAPDAVSNKQLDELKITIKEKKS